MDFEQLMNNPMSLSSLLGKLPGFTRQTNEETGLKETTGKNLFTKGVAGLAGMLDRGDLQVGYRGAGGGGFMAGNAPGTGQRDIMMAQIMKLLSGNRKVKPSSTGPEPTTTVGSWSGPLGQIGGISDLAQRMIGTYGIGGPGRGGPMTFS